MEQQRELTPQREQNRLFGLDHLRTLAITLVVVYHYQIFQHPGWVSRIGSFGWTGVDLFFVLSGYLIAGQLFHKIAAGKGISIGEFYFKRFFRILPAYFVVLTLYFCIPAFREREALSPLWKFLSFTQNIGLNIKTHGTFSHAWSLCIEEQFYLLLPLIMLLFLHYRIGKKAIYLIIFLFAAGFAIRIFCWYRWVAPVWDTDQFGVTWYKWLYYPLWSRLDGLLVGVGLAGLFQFFPAIRDRITRRGNLWLLLGCLLIIGAWFVCNYQYTFHASVFGFPLVALAYGAFVTAAISPSCILYKFNSRISANIAALSYALYLSHKGVIHLTQMLFMKWGLPGDSTWMFLLCMVTSLLGAMLLRATVELPFLRLRDRLLQKRKISRELLPAEMRA